MSADAPRLTFSFGAQTQDKSSGATPTWHIAASSAQAMDEGTLLRQALASFDGHAGIYLAPVLYRPTVQV